MERFVTTTLINWINCRLDVVYGVLGAKSIRFFKERNISIQYPKSSGCVGNIYVNLGCNYAVAVSRQGETCIECESGFSLKMFAIKTNKSIFSKHDSLTHSKLLETRQDV